MVLGWTYKNRRPWLDLENPDCEITLVLNCDSKTAQNISVVDRQGNIIPSNIRTDARATTPLFFLAKMIGRPRTRITLDFRFPQAEPVVISLANGRKPLLALLPNIICPEFLFNLKRWIEHAHCPEGISNFVETGTLFGHTTLYASYWFKRVFTVELSDGLFKSAQVNLRDRPNVTCVHGNSAKKIPEIIPNLTGTSLLFLDAHWSGDKSTDWGGSGWAGYPHDTARLPDTDLDEANRQLPLMQELEAISALHKGAAFVLIDDWPNLGRKNFGFADEDWSNLTQSMITDWFDANPRTKFHQRTDTKRYLWALN